MAKGEDLVGEKVIPLANLSFETKKNWVIEEINRLQDTHEVAGLGGIAFNYNEIIVDLVAAGLPDDHTGFNGGRDQAAFNNFILNSNNVAGVQVRRREILKVIAKRRAIARLDFLRNQLGVDHAAFVRLLKRPVNEGGIGAAGITTEDQAG